jgi:hypothetical protein
MQLKWENKKGRRRKRGRRKLKGENFLNLNAQLGQNKNEPDKSFGNLILIIQV